MVMTRAAGRDHVCIVVQNLPVPFDRRVWNECRALRARGYEVSVICPKAKGDPNYQVLGGVHLYKYPAFPPITCAPMFLAEYAYSVAATFVGLVHCWRRRPFGVVQLCNPPDVLWVAAALFKLLRVAVVFDQHDLCPELYKSRFPDGPAVVHRALLATERITYAVADRVISMNESYRRTAIRRSGKDPEQVRVVRTGPDPSRMRRVEPIPSLRRGHRYLVAYLGVMGPQDGVDLALRAMHHVVHSRGRTDVALTLIGDGDVRPQLCRLAAELGLDETALFTGRVSDEAVAQILSTADLGLSPDPKNPLNDVSTMNKTMEYLAYELPVVAFDLTETRVSAADSALYVQPNDVVKFGDAILALLDDPDRRKIMGVAGRRRVEDVLAWSRQAQEYVALYDELTGRIPLPGKKLTYRQARDGQGDARPCVG